ncbi:DUF624 domain-containing protein [Antribacter sp. KLBMP9083]|uniref:DUF624 domain-containing protein n=1 Tax=Antribacter soli TaxID=2910976 RepID=A0AA41QBQ2_9MICO|nr:DUF624 domain-containing protein [Antribacter soli]MCF4120191.1 DUF624 domain-containing protein [Antribacter soli]
MRIDPESRSVQGLTVLLQFVALNVLYVVACLPVVTAGAATAALYEVTLRYADDERGYLLSGYLVALRRNLWRGTAVVAVLGLPVAGAAFAAVFWLSAGSVLGTAVGVVAVLLAVHLAGALLYGLALVPRYDDPLGRTLRNAMLLPLAEPLRTGWLVLRPLATVAVVYVAPQAVVLVATIGFSVGAYVDALVLHSVFRRRQGAGEVVSPHSGE